MRVGPEMTPSKSGVVPGPRKPRSPGPGSTPAIFRERSGWTPAAAVIKGPPGFMTNSPPEPETGSDALALVPEALRGAIEARGYTSLTPVQQAVLAAEPGRDLRVSSQTGSGKTVAFGLVIGRTLPTLPPATKKGPRVLVMAPTRELAQQVRHELAWLLAPLNLRVLSVTGGTSVRGDLVALRQGAEVVVGTPGRLADHVRSGAVVCDDVAMVILDEADEMLDMGFADELAAVLDKVPSERSMHLVSATFASAVMALANRYQRNPQAIMGTPPGDANADIDHVIHYVARDERLDALVNLLLLAPAEPTLIFTRTREGAAELVRLLREMDLGALLLTGDLDQQERQRTLESFRAGRVRVLVATDVAARGLDVPGITRVIHTDPPEDPDAYTHR
ncbi:MAG: DEAD/DEAH box helicase, partial [Myxococcales bacterium]